MITLILSVERLRHQGIKSFIQCQMESIIWLQSLWFGWLYILPLDKQATWRPQCCGKLAIGLGNTEGSLWPQGSRQEIGGHSLGLRWAVSWWKFWKESGCWQKPFTFLPWLSRQLSCLSTCPFISSSFKFSKRLPLTINQNSSIFKILFNPPKHHLMSVCQLHIMRSIVVWDFKENKTTWTQNL